VQKRKLRSQLFAENELVYIFDSLLSAALYLKQYGISLGNYQSQSVYLSPEGYLKLYMFEIEEHNQHSCFHRIVKDGQAIEEYILAPEQLALISQPETEVSYDPFKADLFAMAVCILELITFEPPKYYYNHSTAALRVDKLLFDLNNHSALYSESFMRLLRNCLHSDPSIRLSLEEAEEQLTMLRSFTQNPLYCIKLQ
jgi:serine/threonine protein kinase